MLRTTYWLVEGLDPKTNKVAEKARAFKFAPALSAAKSMDGRGLTAIMHKIRRRTGEKLNP